MNTNTETMSPADALAVFDSDIERQRIGVAAGRCDPDAMAEFEDARAAVAALIEREAAAMEIVRSLAQLRDGLDNSNSSAEEMAARLAGKAHDLIARAEARNV